MMETLNECSKYVNKDVNGRGLYDGVELLDW